MSHKVLERRPTQVSGVSKSPEQQFCELAGVPLQKFSVSQSIKSLLFARLTRGWPCKRFGKQSHCRHRPAVGAPRDNCRCYIALAAVVAQQDKPISLDVGGAGGLGTVAAVSDAHGDREAVDCVVRISSTEDLPVPATPYPEIHRTDHRKHQTSISLGLPPRGSR